MDYVDGFTHTGLSLLIAEDGSVETEEGFPVLQLANGKYWVNNHTHVLKGENDYETKYLYYALKQVKISPFITGAVQKKISQKALNSIEVRFLENASDRKKVVDTLDAFDQKITLNTQTNQTLEQIAQAIFKHWFIDFAPVHAKANALASGASPEQAELATMACLSGKTLAEITALQHTTPEAYHQLQQTAQAFPSEFVESEMGLVPKGWEVKKVKDIAKFIKGKKPKNLSENQQEGLLPYITMATLSGKNISFASPEGMIIADKLDILISMDGSAGNITIGYKGIVGSTFAKINLTSGKYISFFYQFMKNKEEDIKANTTGTSVPHTDKERVLNYSITIPNDDLINYFSKVHLDLLEKILLNKNENNTLENLRDTLLPKLLNGEIEL
ncbi:restriction endonuclease subunit S [Avibacterium paragallinarum]|uniref:restriction endonuclease subunit S n=1 Tax=Avibacterium paragallinarum TaxID=728 RepID=UPI001EE66850|nr:restriction endonuclease subunit S [Avibacterium paragallinarum]